MKLTEKRLCDLCQNVSKVEMLQSGSGISDKVFKGVKKVKAKVEDLTSEGRKILKDSVKLFNKGKASVEEVVRNVKPFVESVIFKKGKLAGDNKRGCGSAISSTHTVVKKGRGANPWIEHLKKFRASNPGMSYKDAMSKAKLTYKKK